VGISYDAEYEEATENDVDAHQVYSMESTKSKQFIVKNMRADPKLVPLII
jgi:hypothetical protein